ncbi:MAG: beta-lactamase family protein [Acidobacteria bacterium]|nr:beta-lactamase family protein [Acidobacteriota bacterium]
MRPNRQVITRREMVQMGLTASVGAVLPSSRVGAYLAKEPEPTPRDHDFQAVRERILQAIAHEEATGVAVAVAHGGRIIWEEGFGWANRESGLKVTPHTPFSLASITKPFTTTTLITLVAEGKLSLDEPANQYLPKSKLVGPNGNPEYATLRRLGAHAGGLPSMFEHYFSDEPTQPPNAEMLLHDYGRLAYPPGSCYEYSNVGYVALGAIASNVTGVDFRALITRRVLEPLGLSDSFFGTNAARLKNSAVRYDGSGKPIPYYTTSTPPSGELYASAHDLAKFAMFNLKTRVKGRDQALDTGLIDQLHKPVFEGTSGTATTFGWFVGRMPSGKQVLFKSGGQPGVATTMYMLPSENLACLVLTNRSNGRDLAFGICDQIIKMFLPGWTQPSEDIGPSRSPFVATSAFLGQWVGALADGGANMQAKLEIRSSDLATLTLGDKWAEKISEMQSEGTALTGKTEAKIESADAIRNEATMLSLKLLPQDGKLVGRILATGKSPGTLLPYVLTLNRSSM